MEAMMKRLGYPFWYAWDTAVALFLYFVLGRHDEALERYRDR